MESFNIIDNLLVGREIAKNIGDAWEAVSRPGCLIAKKHNENSSIVKRLLLLPPGGFTSNSAHLLSPHPETRWAKIEIKGGVRQERRGFSILKNCIRFSFYKTRDVPLSYEAPYALIDESHPHYGEQLKSAGEPPFFVVREDGFGFYHALQNQSPYWLLLVLEKQFSESREPNFENALFSLPQTEKENAVKILETIAKHGDGVFRNSPAVLERLNSFSSDKILPGLIEGLNVLETGRHEPCTFFALILQAAKQNPRLAAEQVRSALEKKLAPSYYLEELLKKIEKASA